MTKCFTAAFIVISTLLAAQTPNRTISGRLKGSNGEPLVGVNIIVKGTSTGTSTDSQGNYSLTVPIGSTVIFSFIGMKSREILVTEDNLIPASVSEDRTSRKDRRKTFSKTPPFTLAMDSTKPGVAVLSDETPIYKDNGQAIDPQKIRSIKPVWGSRLKNTKTFRVRMSTGFGYSLQFTSAIGIENITQTPSLQNIYAQGQPQEGTLQWRGPDTQEINNWGPPLKILEYDGSNYAYDNNGKLVSAGTGNGKPAQRYDARRFFRTAFNTAYNFTASLQRNEWGVITLNASRKKRSGIIPNAESIQEHIMFQVRRIPIHARWNADINASYNRSSGSLLNRGANFATIIGSVWRTPPSFDNTNGLSPRRADESSVSSRLPDGSIRAHAPGVADNPYGLVQELPDKDLTKHLLTDAVIRYNDKKDFSLTVNTSFEKQWNNVVSGVAPGFSGFPEGRLTQRREDQTYISTKVTPLYKKSISIHRFEFSAAYEYSYQQRHVDRVNGIGFFPDTWGSPKNGVSVSILQNTLTRSMHEILWNADYFSPNSIAILKLSNRSYFSNTLPVNRYSNFFPHIRARINIDQLSDTYIFNEFGIFGSFARTLHEAPLIYSSWSYLSTQTQTNQYNSFYESGELFFNRDLFPETEMKFETGMEFLISNSLFGKLVFHNNTTSDLIAPTWHTGRFVLSNVASANNYGTMASIGWSNRYYQELNGGVTLSWARQKNMVRKLHGPEDFIPLAGFSSTAKVLAEGEPFGAIYGTSYQRDATGQIVIGTDGFPLVDNTWKMIGNPIPDWTGSIDAHIEWKRIRLQCVFDIRKGGDVWNGTQAALDYLGRSATTGHERNISQYVFDGVYENGQSNITPVSFHDPALPLSENRWVRYGFEGVGESYIEDASWIRLSELTVSYSIPFPTTSKIRHLKCSLMANNLFLITGYSGVDPASSLFGYAGSTGLDLFNTPATRTFTAKMTIKI